MRTEGLYSLQPCLFVPNASPACASEQEPGGSVTLSVTSESDVHYAQHKHRMMPCSTHLDFSRHKCSRYSTSLLIALRGQIDFLIGAVPLAYCL